jgi:stage V sporulation protein R
MDLTPELLAQARRIAQYAREYGLDFYDTVFELLDFDELNQVASYGGFPTRYPHWKFGMEYEELSKGYSYGLSKIYELVINNDPCYAYLMKSNLNTDQKLVMAHVYGHCDFFKNNIWFSKTDRKMMDETANHGTRVRRYIDRLGYERVESFLDVCLSIDNLIDYHAPFINRGVEVPEESGEEFDESRITVPKMRSKDCMGRYINPEGYLEEQKKIIEEAIREHKKKFPKQPVKDVLEFLIRYAPMDRWQRDILSMIREEAYYFTPQGQTKIMNEGWASYWHSKMMTERILTDSEIIDYADHHSGTLATRPGSVNPYKIGIELYRDIEDRWNKGRFGKEFEECENMAEKANWDKKLGQGRQKIFDVRRIYNDITFIDTFLTADFCREHGLFTYSYNYKTGQYEISDRDFKAIKQKFLFSLTNFGQPIIYVDDGNFKNRGELLLMHVHEGADLRTDWAKLTLESIFKIWQRPVNIETVLDGKRKILNFDGVNHSDSDVIKS